MFSKLSVLVVATLAAFATAAAVRANPPQANPQTNPPTNPETQTHNPECSTGPVKCCQVKRPATSPDTDLGPKKLGVAIPVGTNIWVTCTDLSVLESQGKTCSAKTVCCKNIATDGSIAIGCNDV